MLSGHKRSRVVTKIAIAYLSVIREITFTPTTGAALGLLKNHDLATQNIRRLHCVRAGSLEGSARIEEDRTGDRLVIPQKPIYRHLKLEVSQDKSDVRTVVIRHVEISLAQANDNFSLVRHSAVQSLHPGQY